MSKINKALDLNKLYNEQKKGKLLKKHLDYPLFGGIKYDGNYTVILKEAQGLITYITSGGHIYTNDEPTVFDEPNTNVGYAYFAERIGSTGQLGDRVNCNLRGSRGSQVSYKHKYKVHDMMPIEEYHAGKAKMPYLERRLMVRAVFDTTNSWASDMPINTRQELENYLKAVVARGFEGVMLKSPHWYWKDTKSRTVDCVKYKKRPTVDLLCIGITEGTKKYEGMIGSLRLKDSKGRIVDVGSGMSDRERAYHDEYFIGKVVEVFYEQILDTYIQPTFGDEYEGVLIRQDKSAEDID